MVSPTCAGKLKRSVRWIKSIVFYINIYIAIDLKGASGKINCAEVKSSGKRMQQLVLR